MIKITIEEVSVSSNQQAINKAREDGYHKAKAHIQFPVCACQFADDEETLISPCAAHAQWHQNLQNRLTLSIRKNYDEQIDVKPWLHSHRQSLILVFERALLNAIKETNK